MNTRFSEYLYHPGDDKETLLLKKIWYIFSVTGLPVLMLAAYMIGKSYGDIVVYLNITFILCLSVPLLVFHFNKNRIENYGFFSQLSIVILTSIKVYFMGGMMLTGTPVYVGFLAPLFALIFPNKKRAFLILLIYVSGMVLATILNPYGAGDHLFAGHLIGFFIGIFFIFFALYHFTTQLQIVKELEQKRVQELDELKTKFFTHIAHEFRAPLSIIIGAAERMLNETDNWLYEGYEIINRNANNLIKLSNKLLELSKLESNSMPLHRVQDNITIYLQYLIESFQSLSESKQINLEFNYNEDILMDFDPDKIQDIISNLLSNAIKFTPRNGSIVVSQDLKVLNDRKWLVLSIKDTGIGIPKEQIPAIFEHYYQAKNHLEALEEGTGLGLALTHEFVKLLGGQIKVKSQVNYGSTFIIELPITNNAKETHLTYSLKNEAIEHVNRKDSKRQIPLKESHLLNLLIVEDNEDVINYLKSLLFNQYNIHIASNGKKGFTEALKVIPDIIISDIIMANGDGLTLCQKLKEDIRTSHIPIILLSALADQKSKLEGFSVGADAYLTKPFIPEELFIRIDKLILLRKSLQKHYSLMIKSFEENVSIVDESKETSFIHKVRYIMEEHLADEDFGINQLCNILAMSRSQLYRKFSSLTDLTVHQYIMTLKLKKAKDLLLTTNLNVSEVAYDTGFKNISHFSRVFTKEFGYNPSNIKIENQV